MVGYYVNFKNPRNMEIFPKFVNRTINCKPSCNKIFKNQLPPVRPNPYQDFLWLVATSAKKLPLKLPLSEMKTAAIFTVSTPPSNLESAEIQSFNNIRNFQLANACKNRKVNLLSCCHPTAQTQNQYIAFKWQLKSKSCHFSCHPTAQTRTKPFAKNVKIWWQINEKSSLWTLANSVYILYIYLRIYCQVVQKG